MFDNLCPKFMFSGRDAAGDCELWEEDGGLFSVIVDTHLTLDWETQRPESAGAGSGAMAATGHPGPGPPVPPLSLSLGPGSRPGVQAGTSRKKHFVGEVWTRFNLMLQIKLSGLEIGFYENKLLNLS